MRWIVLLNMILLLLLISGFVSIPEDAAATSPIPIENAFWTYHASSRNDLQGAGNYTGTFENTVTVKGHATIVLVNSSTFVIEKTEETNFSVNGSGYFKQETRADTYNFTERIAIDRNTLTYRARTVRNEVDNSVQQDPSVVGMPAVEFVSTSLKDSQEVPYYSITGKVMCAVSYGSVEFQGSNLPVIILRYTGPTAIDPWLETNSTADYTFNFERSTGLLVSSSMKLQASSAKGSRLTNFNYMLDSTSVFSSAASNPTSSSTQPPSTGTPPPTSPPEGPAIITGGNIYVILFLVIIIIGAAVAMTHRKRSRAASAK